MKIKIHEKFAGYDSAGNELKVFYIKTIEIVEQILIEMLESAGSKIACRN